MKDIKRTVQFLILMLISISLTSQVENPMFEKWDLLNGREKPVGWYCPNLCSTPTCGPCDKIVEGSNDLAVRIHNVMPCVSSDNQAKSRSAGFIEDYFIPEYDNFKISFDLSIDSIEFPADFIFTLRGKSSSVWSDSILIWKTDQIQSKRIEHLIELREIYDSLFIQFKTQGYIKENALHDCDMGYISAVVDNIETSQVVNIEESLTEQILIFPNPFQDQIQINGLTTSANWKIKNIVGKDIIVGTGIEAKGLQKLKPGTYFLSIVDAKKRIVKQIIKIE